MSAPSIALLDFTQAHQPETRDRFIEQLGAGLESLGFVAIEGHGIDWAIFERAFEVARETFALPSEVKARYEDPASGRQRGYTPFGVEHAKDTAVPDLKEFWHVGPSLAADHPLTVRGAMPINRFPEEQPEFKAVFEALFKTLQGFAFELLDAIGAWLGHPPSYFRDLATDGNSVLRIINYPDMGLKVVPGAVRAAAHEDINLLTVLPASTRPGLELMTRDGQWISVDTPPGVLICDTGDMMQLVTAGRLPATTHRVVNPPGADGGRMSMPFFMHPHPDAILTPMTPGFADPISVQDFFGQRLKATGVS